MALHSRVWTLGKVLLLLGALGATFLVSATVAMQMALRARQVEVPQLVGQTVDEATTQLLSLGLSARVDEVARVDTLIPEGRIMQQDPPGGARTRDQRSVRLWVSAGQSATTVPLVIGQTERTARLRLQEESIDVSSTSEFRSPDYAADAVVAQDLPTGTVATRVSLLINRGEQSVSYVMPDVIGMDGLAASEALRARGLRVTITGSQPYPGVPPGTVVRQQPAGGFRVASLEPIALEVSR